MRYEPVLVDGVPMKSAADLIVNAAIRHFVEGEHRHMQRQFVAGTVAIAQQKIDIHAGWKLGGAAESAFTRIEASRERAVGEFQHRFVCNFALA